MYSITDSHEINIDGLVQDVIYFDDKDGFTVLHLQTDCRALIVVVCWCCVRFCPGSDVAFLGRWFFHKKHGRQFVAEAVYERLNPTKDMAFSLLVDLVPGIGRLTVKKIANKYGASIFCAKDETYYKLSTIAGIGKARSDMIKNFVKNNIVCLNESSYYLLVTSKIGIKSDK